ncbi:Aln6 [Paramicrosporidium saccamoebae]|uniref:Aln6 n=1 Tax=Paramicrosporidium saccamoebae TaxID=1246581 RepID=A0A2H9TPR8_9FUNG|nr:Aln6 [Paramicrosporidium saccamoebae]
MRLRILLALTTVASASTKLFEYNGSENPIAFPNGKFRCLDSPYNEDTGENIPQSQNGDLCPTPEGLIIECSPSHLIQPQFVPGAQFFMYTDAQFPVQPGKLAIEMTSSVHIYGVEDHPFGDKVQDPHKDPLLACTAITVHPHSDMLFSFVFTNEAIYAFVTKLLTRPEQPGAQYLIPLITTRAGAVHTTKFILNNDSKSINWLIDGEQQYSWQQGAEISEIYLLRRPGENAVFQFPTGKVGASVGILSFWDELKGERTTSLDLDTLGVNPTFGEQAQKLAESVDNKWSPKVIFTINSITVTQEY